jgi:hypothetical protein
MKKAILGIILLFSLSAYSEDMNKYLNDTQALVRNGSYKEALDRFIWFHNHAEEKEPAISAVRLSFALAYWKQLGLVYPPAMDAMTRIRDMKTSLLENGKGEFQLCNEVAALNRTLEQESKTVELFRILDRQESPLTERCWLTMKDPIIKAKAYDLAKKYLGDPVRAFNKIKAMYEMNAARYGEKNFGESFRASYENRFIEDTLSIINVAIASGKTETALDIRDKALAVLDDPRLRKVIQ